MCFFRRKKALSEDKICKESENRRVEDPLKRFKFRVTHSVWRCCSAMRRIWPLWCGSFLGQKSERHLSDPCQVFQVCKECHFCVLCLRCIARLGVWVYRIVNAEKYYFSWILRSSWIKPGQLKTNIGKVLDRNDARVADVGCPVDGMRSLIPFQCHEYDALNDQS